MKTPCVNPTDKLNTPYQTVPNHQQILECAQKGRNLYIEECKRFKVNPFVGKIHTEQDITLQAFALIIVNQPNERCMTLGARNVFWAHNFDDYTDSPRLKPSYNIMKKYLNDIEKLLDTMENLGKYSLYVVQQSKNSNILQAIKRLVYGALMSQTHDKKIAIELWNNFMIFNLLEVNSNIKQSIMRQVSPIVYSLTHKVGLNMFTIKYIDTPFLELFNLIYTPAIIYHDIQSELNTGELSCLYNNITPESMIPLIDIPLQYLKKVIIPHKLAPYYFQQFKFVNASFSPVLPDIIKNKYTKFEQQFEYYLKQGNRI